MGGEAAPRARLHTALERGNLLLAEAAARDCAHLDLSETLGICVLMARAADPRYERAAVRWLSRLLSAADELGFGDARRAIDALDGLTGPASNVARADLVLLLRAHGLTRAAQRAARVGA